MNTYEPFATWEQVIDHVRAGYPLYYHAPLDHKPSLVSAVIRKGGNLRCYATYRDVDPFTADVAHLPRFRKLMHS